jgi:hypothetical protein
MNELKRAVYSILKDREWKNTLQIHLFLRVAAGVYNEREEEEKRDGTTGHDFP